MMQWGVLRHTSHQHVGTAAVRAVLHTGASHAHAGGGMLYTCNDVLLNYVIPNEKNEEVA